MKKNIKFLAIVHKNLGLWLYEPLMAVAVAKGTKPSATAVEIWPSVDLCSKLSLTQLLHLLASLCVNLPKKLAFLYSSILHYLPASLCVNLPQN